MQQPSPYIKEYAEFLNGFLHDDARALDVVFDCSNGSTGQVVQALRLQAASDRRHGRWIFLNEMPDGNFPNHAPDPLHAGAMDALQKKVISDRAAVGVIFDADGDRAVFVDERGRFVSQDAVAYLLLWFLRPKRFVTDMNAGWIIKRQPFGAECIESKTGHYFVKQAMREHRAAFGYEGSGHYYFKDFFFCDSGIMTAINVLNAVARLPYRLSEFVDLLPITYASAELDFHTPFHAHGDLLSRIERAYVASAARTSKLDGIAMEFLEPAWHFVVRFSNTEPLVRLRIEAREKSVYDEQLKKLTTLLKQGRK